MVYTRYHIDEHRLSFTLWDVPGQSLTGGPEELKKKIIKNIVNGCQPANKPIDTDIRRTKRDERIHAVVCVQDATAEIDGLHRVVIDAVLRQDGRSVPVFLIMTHADILIAQHQLDAAGMDRKKKEFAQLAGLTPSVTFCIANYDHMHQYNIEDPQRENYIREMLLQILSSAKMYKSEVERGERREAKSSGSSCQVM
ncbi:uncharacterized protein LOC144444206 [Glandiceps talaboti]